MEHSDMDTLYNVDVCQAGRIINQSTGYVPDVTPKREMFHVGQSVDYAHDASRRWYVLRPTYGRAMKALHMIRMRGVAAYLPVRKVRRVVDDDDGPSVYYEDRPLLTNIVFAYGGLSEVEALLRGPDSIDFLTPYYNHFRHNEFGRNEYLTVDYGEMMSFMRVVEADNENVIMADPRNRKLTNGQLVRVVDGEFKGVVGRVARYKGQQRVFVHLDGVCLVGTAYIPSYLLEIIDERPAV